MYDAICLASGGLDSVVCLHLLRQQNINALPVFINYGQKNHDREFGSLVENARISGLHQPLIVDVSGFGRVVRTGLTDPKKRVLEDAFTPNRNLILLTLAASVAFGKGASSVVLGFLSEATAIFPDQTDRFLRAAEDAISESLGVSITIVCPLRDMTKSDVVRLSKALGIEQSYSCHDGGAEPCGKCIACLEYTAGG